MCSLATTLFEKQTEISARKLQDSLFIISIRIIIGIRNSHTQITMYRNNLADYMKQQQQQTYNEETQQ